MKYALCLYSEDRWCPVDQEIEVDSLVEALSRMGDRYKAENLGYQETPPPGVVKLFATDFDRERKINAIKEMRNKTGLGLKEAKDAVESLDNGPFCMGEFTIDKAREILRPMAGTAENFLRIELGPDTHPGVAMILKLQKMGRSNYGR